VTTGDSGPAGRALDLRLLRRLAGWLRGHGPALLVSIAMLPITSGFEVAQPYLLKRAIDEHVAPHRLEGLDALGALYLLCLVGQYTSSFAHNYLVQIVGQKAMNDLRLAVHRHVLRLSAAFFDRTPLGQLMTRMTNDIESLSELFASGIISLLGDLVRLSLIIVVMFRTDAALASFSMAAVPVLALIAVVFRRWMRDAFRAIRAKLARMNAFLQEHLSGIKVVQAFAQERRVRDEFTQVNEEYRGANARAIAADAALYSVVEAVASIAVASLLWHGGGRIAAGALTFGVLVQFIEYLGKFFAPLRDLSTKFTVMQQAMTAAERVFAILDRTDLDGSPPHPAGQPVPGREALVTRGVAGPRTAPAPATAPDAAPPAVELRHVRFGYRPGHTILHDLSLAIARGETVAVVGATGSGKSTLIKLLSALYRPQAGEILIDGVEVGTLDVKTLRRRLVVVNQDVFLFAGTIGDNIALGEPALTPDKILEAARLVGADRVIDARPEGLDARVLERGANLSAGERQLIAFARALARDPALLVLDEATASVDPEVERLIERGIAELMRGRTSIVIAHRLSTVRRADRIVVLDRGAVVEEGTHDDLLARNGAYAHLYRLQMQAAGSHARGEAAE
jgi:ATP-binding cassette subfamily B multidrug efflux pump